MARGPNHHNNPPAGKLPEDASQEQVRIEFGRRLQAELTKRNWSQADLIARSETIAGEGRPGLKTWDVSNYIRGRSLARADKLALLAKTLGLEPNDLLPHRGVPEVRQTVSPMEMRQTEDGNVWLRMNRVVSYPTALKIMALLSEEDERLPKLLGDVRTRDPDTGRSYVQKAVPSVGAVSAGLANDPVIDLGGRYLTKEEREERVRQADEAKRRAAARKIDLGDD